jgi:hypothetical protein
MLKEARFVRAGGLMAPGEGRTAGTVVTATGTVAEKGGCG